MLDLTAHGMGKPSPVPTYSIEVIPILSPRSTSEGKEVESGYSCDFIDSLKKGSL